MNLYEYKKNNNLTFRQIKEITGLSIGLLSKIANGTYYAKPKKDIIDKLKKIGIDEIQKQGNTGRISELIKENEELKRELKRLKKQLVIINDNLSVLKNMINNTDNLTHELMRKDIKLRRGTKIRGLLETEK